VEAKTEAIISFFKRHPKLVPVDDFEVAVQKTNSQKKRYQNGELVWSGDEERFWVFLKIKHRNKPGLASATVVDEGILEDLVVSALESAESSQPDPWFRFPVWLPLPPNQNKSRLEEARTSLDSAFVSSWPQLKKKDQRFQEQYEIQKNEIAIFRRSEKDQRRSLSTAVYQDWDLMGAKDFWWGIDDRAARLSKLEELTLFQEAIEKKRDEMGSILSLSPRALAPLLVQISKWFCPEEIYQKTSPLAHRAEGDLVFSPALTLMDDGSQIANPLATPIDLEGIAMQKTVLINKGHFQAPLLNAYYGAVFNCKSTGNAFRIDGSSAELGIAPRALCIDPGERSVEEVWSEMGAGFAVEQILPLVFSGRHLFRGDLWGWEIKKGKKLGPVFVRNQAMNLVDLMNQVRALSLETEICGRVQTPTIFFGTK